MNDSESMMTYRLKECEVCTVPGRLSWIKTIYHQVNDNGIKQTIFK